MRSRIEEGRLQVTAAASLLQQSGLLHWQWQGAKAAVAPANWQEFENAWRKIDPDFGRFACWITFCAGAELLVKGVCLAHGLDIGRRPQSFGTLDGALKRLGGLFEKVPASPAEQELIRATYKTLKKVRDRDVHAYVPNVRNNDFNLVVEPFARCCNLMMSWDACLPGGFRMSSDELQTCFSQT